ncbi:MAG: FG-GAP-like repeat-containing protein [Candidatus Kapaibacterium sp.]
MVITILYYSVTIAQVYFPTTPVWVSTDAGYDTGCGWADINGDGWVDLVVAKGNDMSRQKVVVYYNTGGNLPFTPSWQSNDIDYHGQLSIGDINKDGYPDVAVSVYIGQAGFSQKGKLKIYLNNNGTLSQNPSWVSQDSLYTFSCAFGDADGDGDLDLAAACGESYNLKIDNQRIYYNNNGVFEYLPSWKSLDQGYGMDANWADFDNDGRLDLVFCCERGPSKIYKNYGDSIGRMPIWTSQDASQYSNSLFVNDIDNDGWLDLAIADNNQIGGSGKFKIYKNNSGTMNANPFWTSNFSGYGSGINLCDINNDNFCDLICGAWWSACWIYVNNAGTFSPTSQWTSATNSVVETIAAADYDHDGLDTLNAEFVGNGVKKLFYLSKNPLQKLLNIKFGNDTIPFNQFCYVLENGWVSFGAPPTNGTNISIKVLYTHDPDFAVSNWDNNIGNYLFKNTIITSAGNLSLEMQTDFKLLQNYPNPFNPTTKIEFTVPKNSDVRISVFDVTGKEVAVLVNETLQAGTYQTDWNASAFSSGVYFYRMVTNRYSETKRMMLVR